MKIEENIRLSVIIPILSETTSVIETVDRLLQKDRNYIYEILIVVSPESSKECMDICEDLARQNVYVKLHLQTKNPGLGWAVREGMEKASGTHVALMCGDLETEPEAVDRMINKLNETSCDGVIANRWMNGGGFRHYNRFKLILNLIFQHAFGLLFRTKLRDLTYGYKILSKAIVENIQWEGTLHEIAVETTIRPLKMGFHMEQVPSVWIRRNEGRSKNTFLRNLRYVYVALKVLFKG